MASPPPSCDDAKTAVVGYPVPPPPSKGRRPPDYASKSPHSRLPSQPHAPLSGQQLQTENCGVVWCCACLSAPFMAIFLFFFLVIWFAGPDYPILTVAGLTVSNLTVTASAGATWEAFILVENPLFGRDSFFHGVECFVYYHSDAAKPLVLGSAEPFELQDGGRTVIKVKMMMERPEQAVVEDMDRERRSVGTVAVGLGLRMQGTSVRGLWKRNYGHMDAYCDNLRVAFADSTGEGSLVASNNNLVTDHYPLSFIYKGHGIFRDHPSDNP